MRLEDPELQKKIQQWFHPLSDTQKTLGEVLESLHKIGLKQDEIPFIIKMIENPKYDYLPGIDIFHGATDLFSHDCIHILLGRGLLAKDEAFVIGFTMGSTNRVSTTEEKLYSFFSKYLYPRQYRFSKEDIQVFKHAVRLGFISNAQPLSEVDYHQLMDWSLSKIRKALSIEENLLRAYYEIEKKRFPQSLECQRLLD